MSVVGGSTVDAINSRLRVMLAILICGDLTWAEKTGIDVTLHEGGRKHYI